MKPNFVYDETENKLIDKGRGISLTWIDANREYSKFRLDSPQGHVEFVLEREPNLGTPYWTIWKTVAQEYFFDDGHTSANALIEETMKVWGFTPGDQDLGDGKRWAKTLVKFYAPLKAR